MDIRQIPITPYVLKAAVDRAVCYSVILTVNFTEIYELVKG